MTGENGYVHPMNVPSQAIPNDDSFSMNGIYKPRNDWLGSLGHVVEHSLDGEIRPAWIDCATCSMSGKWQAIRFQNAMFV
jgi:hypothetical protein